jgi:hypothetical protein
MAVLLLPISALNTKKRAQPQNDKTNVSIEVHLHRRLRILAAHRGVRIKDLANDAIREYLTRNPLSKD